MQAWAGVGLPAPVAALIDTPSMSVAAIDGA